MIDKRYERRNQVADLIAWLLIFAIVNILIGIAIAHAEPGDKYEISIRDAPSPVAKKPARALNMSPQTQAASGRPIQCIVKRYCGCAVALRVFGEPRPKLFRAANWLHFPRTFPAPGMVAARHGHVMMLLAPVSGGHWLVYDPNSGGGLTREHVRSLSGFTIVNPQRI